MLAPFEEIEHTADIAFNVRGRDFTELYFNAVGALGFIFPPIIQFKNSSLSVMSIEDVIINLNVCVTLADSAIGAPFKAVSFHHLLTEKNGIYFWEMIIDV